MQSHVNAVPRHHYPRTVPDTPEPSLPKITPWLARVADTLCPRRLDAEFTGASGTRDPVARGRVRDALLDALRTFHATGTMPAPAAFLEPEERAVLAHALGWYPRLFDTPVASVEMPIEAPTPLARRRVRLGGWVDLGVVHPDGRRELRQLALGARAAPADPLDLEATRLAALRLASIHWVADGPLDVVWADLLHGERREATVRVPGDLADLGRWLDERLVVISERIADPLPSPGHDCATCRFVVRCPAHDVRGSMSGGSEFLPDLLSLAPTSLDTWLRCPREWRNRVLLQLPVSDPIQGTEHGLFLHHLLRFVHDEGSCHDNAHVGEVLAAHGGDDRTAEEIRRHAERCPRGATALGHEVAWARAAPRPPVFMATARLDAVWVHDGILEVRDYKTGTLAPHDLRDDPRARLQAWVAAPAAESRGLALRLRYEYLSAEIRDDPEPWDPDDDDLAAIDDDLRRIVGAMRTERAFAGVSEEAICRRCGYRSICPDSAATSAPVWPAIEDDTTG